MMKYLTFSLVFVVLMGTDLFAQKPRGYTYDNLFVAPGGGSGSKVPLHFGFGLEHALDKGFRIGGEIGLTKASIRAVDGGGDSGILSANGSYYFPAPDSRKLIPFVSGGYSLGFRGNAVSGFNFGGGVYYFFFRVEFRDHVFQGEHVYGFRISVPGLLTTLSQVR